VGVTPGLLVGTVEFEGVTKVFRGGARAVSSLDLEVPDGSFFVLLGPSGCGKSTVLRLVAGLEEVTEGVIRIGGRDVTEDSPRDRDIAMVFQNYALYPHMTVFENMAFGLRTRRVKKAQVARRVQDAAKILGLQDLLMKRPATLSGGQRQRVAMGRAIVREPQVFLMDEPLSNLDAKLRVDMRGEIAHIQRTVGVTTLYVTHDQLEAMTLGDHVAVMRDGVLQQVGTPSDVYERPANLFVAGFVGVPSMNLVEATVVREDGVPGLAFGGHHVGIDDRVFERHPRLRLYEGRQVVVGIRPADLMDAALIPNAPADARLSVVAARVESMGRDIFVQFDVDAPLLMIRDPRDDDGDEAEPERWAAERVNRFVARLDDRSDVREGTPIDLVVETEHLHVFDPVTSEAIGA
jgi:multiple sugar transport system ATP-binding protein